jgi:hypothetical protein
LPCEPDAPDLAGQTVDALGESILRRIDSALAPGQFSLNAARMKALGLETWT